jgi:hypothetical protein
MMAQLGTLLHSVNEAAGTTARSRSSPLVRARSPGVLKQAGQQFRTGPPASRRAQVDEVAAHVAASAVELSSLGESFSSMA